LPAQLPGLQAGLQVLGGQAGKQVLVDVLHHLRRPHIGRRPADPALLQGGFAGHVRQGQALAAGLVGVGGVVVAQGLLDLERQGVLALNAVAVIGIHGPQEPAQPAQGLGLHLARELVSAADQVARLLQQGPELVLPGQQRFHLRGVVIEREFLRLSEHV
jgi:hypothetical protein